MQMQKNGSVGWEEEEGQGKSSHLVFFFFLITAVYNTGEMDIITLSYKHAVLAVWVHFRDDIETSEKVYGVMVSKGVKRMHGPETRERMRWV